ncbi:uncharacterized protein LOC120894628 [Anopheles arabiensis]|uniref:uncharacterized protein LOC120894628 n=1 Tax=Anopheles arabiensis TaxID=7173 RepID=UPI001AAD5D3C|nr:uncharacterized protein LOC120894628 [Anopheles arabiensis]
MTMARARELLLFAACLLSMTFVAAKPDFGVDVMIRGSVAVQGTAVMIEERLSELTKHMSFSLVSSYGLLSDLRTQMDLLARKVATIGTTFATALNQASTSNSNVTATFHPVLLSLTRLQTLQVDELPPILAEIEKLVKLSIKLELQDSFKTLQSSVQLMVGAVVQLTAAVIDNPVSIDVSIVNMVTRVASMLRANTVPLNYTIASTGENIRAADTFLGRLSRSVQTTTTTVENDFTSFMDDVEQLQDTTLQALGCTKQEISGLGASVEPLLAILCDSSGPCDIRTTVTKILQLQSDDQDEVALTVREQFSKLTPYKTILTSVASVTFSRAYELGLYLADVTAMKGPYGLYCLNKYASVVEQLLPRVRDGLIVCYRQEHTRLRTLRTSLLNMYATFVYDFEDLFDQLQLCTAESGNFSFLTAMNGLYTQLVEQMKKKLELMKSFLVAETTSSARRLLLCGTEASLAVANDRAQLWSEIGECRQKGPSYNVPIMEV